MLIVHIISQQEFKVLFCRGR